MTSRLRQSTTATPRASRLSTNAAAAPTPTARRSQQQARGVAPPDYEPPTHALNLAGQANLQTLMQSRKIDQFDGLMQEAIAALSENAAAINDALRDKETAVRKDKARHERDVTDDDDDDEEAARIRRLEDGLEKMREKVGNMTKKMEQDLLKMLDTREYFGAIRPALQETSNDTSAFSRQNPTQSQPQARSTRNRSQTHRQRAGSDEEEEEEEEEDGDDEEYQDFTPTDPANAHTQNTPAPPAPSSLFREKLSRKKDRYQNLSKRQRYASDNDYRNFRRIVHDARYGDTVPLPHESTWFSDSSAAPAPGVTARAEDSDDDLQIAKETISTKCPLTLQEFREPLTSTKCPHSFEKDAILGMIDNPSNTMRVGGSNTRGARDGQKAVQCPVPGCSHVLTKNDLHSDPVLLRKIRRIQKANAEEEDGDDDIDDQVDGGRSRPQEIESGGSEDEGDDIDNVYDEADLRRIKRERLSGMQRASQRP
ncbi:hypothetical protein AAFC00_000300 [Neodothiora populina]|uniref:SP-RING-type domain-containing protein n=1 Tax=Neodothiora populina TaxID=2781224 RepID=A0ABR3PCF8_9PEZI